MARNKRSLIIAGHRTSVSLEDEFWETLAAFARADGKSLAAMVAEIDKRRGERSGPRPGLSAAIRLYVLERLKGGTP